MNSWRMWRNKVSAALLLLTLIPAPVLGQGNRPVADCRPDVALFATSEGVQNFTVEIADNDESRARGLMFRRGLDENAGMLFVYDRPRTVSFWMRNTYIPLDLIFMDSHGVIRHIHHNARPLDETSIPGAAIGDPNPERQMILEIAAGEADRRGLKPGIAMAHPRLDQKQAEWRCK